MSRILYVIDGYLSSTDKVDVTIELIQQLKRLDPNRKIMLINKYPNSWGIENMVDYYREYVDGFLVGYPPQEYIDSTLYDKPYVYYETYNIILENWMPLIGVSDHVANVYNGFIYAMNEAKELGFTKVFRIEYDMLFDDEEFKRILEDINEFENQDYLIYGKRKEGVWANNNQSLIDIHFCGYSDKLVDGYDLVKNDTEFWNLCKKIGYMGKWAEYVLSMVFQSNITDDMVGKVYEQFIRTVFTKSKFDRISSSGEWTDKWKYLPKICKVDSDNGHNPEPSKIGIFYLNMDYDFVEIETISNKDYYKKIKLNKGAWLWDIIERQDNMVFMTKMVCDGVEETWVEYVNDNTYDKLNCRMVLK
jgi:hypothetical protein